MGTGVPGHWQYAGKAEMQAMTRKSGYPPMSVFVSGWRGAGAGLQTSAILPIMPLPVPVVTHAVPSGLYFDISSTHINS